MYSNWGEELRAKLGRSGQGSGPEVGGGVEPPNPPANPILWELGKVSVRDKGKQGGCCVFCDRDSVSRAIALLLVRG